MNLHIPSPRIALAALMSSVLPLGCSGGGADSGEPSAGGALTTGGRSTEGGGGSESSPPPAGGGGEQGGTTNIGGSPAGGSSGAGGSSPTGSGGDSATSGGSGSGSGGRGSSGGTGSSGGGASGSGSTGSGSTGAGSSAGGSGSGGASSGGAVSASGGASPAPRDLTVFIAGDSTVSTYTDTASPNDQAGWGQMLHEIFDDHVSVENHAAGGRTALWFYLEGTTDLILSRIAPGDYFFIQFGTNDSHPTATFTVDGVTYPRYAAADGDFKQHLKDYYLDPTRSVGAIPVLVTPPPRNSAYCGTGNSLGGYAEAMRELAQVEDVVVLDLNQKTFDYLAAICPAPTPEDFFFVRTDGTVDGTHFQEGGARHMADFLGEETLRTGLELARSLVSP